MRTSRAAKRPIRRSGHARSAWKPLLILALVACGGTASRPRPPVVAAAPVPPTPPADVEFARLRTALQHETLIVDDQHFADGGARFIRERGRIRGSRQVFEDSLIAATQVGDQWYFLTLRDNTSTLWIASSYLGPAQAVRNFMGRASLFGGEEAAIVDGEARLHRHGGNDWSAVSALDDYAIVTARSVGGRFFARERGGRWLENSSLQGWSTTAPPSEPAEHSGNVDMRVFDEFIARYPREGFTHSALVYLGQGRFGDERNLISREGVRVLPIDAMLGTDGMRHVSFRTSLLGGLILRTENDYDSGDGQWWFMDPERANYRRLEFPPPPQAIEGGTAVESFHTEFNTLLWECRTDLVCWIRPEQGTQTQVPVMGFQNAAVRGMRGGHLYLLAETGQIDVVELTTGVRRPLPLPDNASAYRIWFIDSGFIATPEDADFAYRYNQADGSFERLQLPFAGVVMSMASGRVMVVDNVTRHALSSDGGATWQDLRVHGSQLDDDFCYLDACVIGDTVISEVGTFPAAEDIPRLRTPFGAPPAPPPTRVFRCDDAPQASDPGPALRIENDRLHVAYREGRRARTFEAPLPANFRELFVDSAKVVEVGPQLAAFGDADSTMVVHTSGANHFLGQVVFTHRRANGDIDLVAEHMHLHVRASDGSLAAENSDTGWTLEGDAIRPVRRHMHSRWTWVHEEERRSFRFDANEVTALCTNEPGAFRLLTNREDTGLTLFRMGESPCIESVHVPGETFLVDGDALQSERRRCLLE